MKPSTEYLQFVKDGVGYFYLTCNACDRVIKKTEMTKKEYNLNGGYCPECFAEMVKENGYL